MKMLQFEGSRLAEKHIISVSKFKVSYGWVKHVMARHDLTITALAQRLPAAYEEKLVSFKKYVLKLRKQHDTC
jgi:hypothetical protein